MSLSDADHKIYEYEHYGPEVPTEQPYTGNNNCDNTCHKTNNTSRSYTYSGFDATKPPESKSLMENAFWRIPVVFLAIIIALVLIVHVVRVQRYNSAIEKVEAGNYLEAISILENLAEFNYTPAYDELLHAKYLQACNQIDEGEYANAYDILDEIKSSYQDAATTLDQLLPLMYAEAISAYYAGEYSSSHALLTRINDYSDSYSESDAYLTLAECHLNGITGNLRTDVLSLVGFADANELIENDEITFCYFLQGDWYDINGTGLHYSITNNGGTSFSCNTNFPYKPSGKYFFIDCGIYRIGNTLENSTEYLDLTIIDNNTITIHSCMDNSYYLMVRS